MRLPPTDVLSTWPQPNYINPHTQGQSLVVTNVVFMVLMTLAVTLRYYSRLSSHKHLGLDDIFIGIALFFSLGLGAIVILANVRYGWNRHTWDVQLSQYQNASIIAFAAKIVFTIAATFTRISLICFYFRLIRDSGHVKIKWVLWFSVAWQIAVCITFVLLVTFLCSPVEGYWNILLAYSGKAKCLDEGTVTLAAGIINCISDLMITVLPIPIIMRLRMPLKQRIGVTVLLSIGFIVTIAGIIRTVYIWKALIDTYDETWFSYPLWICAAVEIDLAVLCACAPALKPLFQPLVSTVLSLSYNLKPSTFRLSDPGSNSSKSKSKSDASTQPSSNKEAQVNVIRTPSRASSQKGLFDGYDKNASFGWMGWRPDAAEGTGPSIELKGGRLVGLDDEDFGAANHHARMSQEREYRGPGVQKRFDVSVASR